MQNIFADLISLFFPRICFGCGGALVKGERMICTVCRINLPKTNLHLTSIREVEDRFFEVQKLHKAMAYLYFQKGGIVQNLLFEFKYRNHPEIGKMLGEWYGSDLKAAGFEKYFDIILSVPLHWTKKRSRGYNQSDYFAKGLAKGLGVKWDGTIIKRVKRSETQTLKSRIERWNNVEKIFRVKKGALEGMRVLLVDDVVTTGATMSICAKELENAGCETVSVASIALAQ